MDGSSYTPMEQVGNKIVAARKMRGMSAQQLALEADMPQSMLSAIEHGRKSISLDVFFRIASALKVPLSYLQPDELDRYSSVPSEMQKVVELSRSIPSGQRIMIANMMAAAISTVQ